MRVPGAGSRKKFSDFLINLTLLSVNLVCWFYVLYAGRAATLRYLEKIDFTTPEERITVLQLQELSEQLLVENTNSTLE